MAGPPRRSILRSISPAAGVHSATTKSPSVFASTASVFAPRCSNIFHPQVPSTAANANNPATSNSASSVRFSFDRQASPSRSIAVMNRVHAKAASENRKRTCMCSPTKHPGSFRCSLHKNMDLSGGGRAPTASPYNSNRLNMRRSAMTNSLVRIGTVEGDLVKRALGALIRPSSHHQRRRAGFRPRPSPLSSMSKA